MGALFVLACLAGEAGQPLRLDSFDAGLPRDGQWRHGFAVADMNGDGHPDIAHGPPRKGGALPVVFLGDGAGSWRPWREAVFPLLAYVYGDAAAADFDGDGHADIALAMHATGLVMLRGDGKGRFERVDTGLPYDGATFTSRAIAAVDWNRDGRPDLVALGEGPMGLRPDPRNDSRGIRIFFNGPAPWRQAAVSDSTLFGDAVAVGDFNDDGWPDAVSASNTMGMAAVIAMNDTQDGWLPTALPGLPARAIVTAAAAADVDGDGRDEAIAAWTAWDDGAQRHGISLFRLVDEGWEERNIAEHAAAPFSALAAGDIDGDGFADLAAGDAEGRLHIWRGTGAGLAYCTLDEAAAGVGRCYTIELADMDRDGADEIAAGFARESGGAFRQTGAAESSSTTGSLRVWKAVRDTPANAPSPQGEPAS